MSVLAERVRSFLDSANYQKQRLGELGRGTVESGPHPFITISRQAGAGGHTLGDLLIGETKRMGDDPAWRGWEVFDQDLCRMVVDHPALLASLESLMTAECLSGVEDAVEGILTGSPGQDLIIQRIFRAMRFLATAGRVVLIGRGGACLLRDLPGGVHIRLVASMPARIRRFRALHQVSEAEATALVRRIDRGRANLVRSYFSREIEDPLLYDMVWNTDAASMEEIARSTLELTRSRAATAAGHRSVST